MDTLDAPIYYEDEIKLNQSQTFLLENKIIDRKSFRLEHLFIWIMNCTLLNSNIEIKGNNKTSVMIRNCTLNRSEIFIYSADSCKIISGYFIPKAEHEKKESNFMLEVWNTYYLEITQTTSTGSVHSNANKVTNHTQSGVKMHNLLLAKVTHCTFNNIQSKVNDGSALYVTSSSVYIRKSQFVSNMARYGVMYATNHVNITTEKCSFISNFAHERGGGVYISSNSSLTNINSFFLKNIARSRGAAIYMKNYVQCLNFDCSFRENSGPIFAENSVNITNRQCNFTDNYGHHDGWPAVLYMSQYERDGFTQVCINQECIFHGNRAYVIDTRNLKSKAVFLFNQCTFTENEDENNDDLPGIIRANEAEFIITNCSFMNNRGGRNYRGGGGLTQFTNTNLTVLNSIFLNNSAVLGKGGAISLFVSSCNIINSDFLYNSGNSRCFLTPKPSQ